MSSTNTASTIYEDAASLGKFRVSFGLILATIISLVLIGYSVYLLFIRKNPYTETTDATILSSTCNKKTNVRSDCRLNINYTINNVMYLGSLDVDNQQDYNVNDIIKVYYNPSNPYDISLRSKKMDKTLAYTFLLLAAGVFLIALFFWWLANRYKFLAAGEGVGMVVNTFR